MPPFPPNTSGVHTMGLLLMYPCTRVGYPVCYSRSIYRQTVPARVFPGPARPSRVCPYSPSAVRSPAGPLGDALVVGPPPPPRCCSFSFFPPFLWRLFLLVWRRSLPLSAAAAAAIQSSAPPPPPGPPATSPAALAPSAAGTAAAAASSAAPACPGRSPRPRRPPGSACGAGARVRKRWRLFLLRRSWWLPARPWRLWWAPSRLWRREKAPPPTPLLVPAPPNFCPCSSC